MKYLVRLNPKAFNPITQKVIVARLWEVEQCSNKDSEKVIWHCANVRVDGQEIRELFYLPKTGEKPFELSFSGICVRGQDDSIELKAGQHDVQY